MNQTRASDSNLLLQYNQEVTTIELFGSFYDVSEVFLSTTPDCSIRFIESFEVSPAKISAQFPSSLLAGSYTYYLGYTANTAFCYPRPLQIQIKTSLSATSSHLENFGATFTDANPRVVVGKVDVDETIAIFSEINCAGAVLKEIEHLNDTKDYSIVDLNLLATGIYNFSVLKSDDYGNKHCENLDSKFSYLGWSKIVSIVPNPAAFAAIREDGSVIAWGHRGSGGDSSQVSEALNGSIDVTQVVASSSAFAALRADGSVITWGDSTNGGNSATVATSLNGTIDVTHIASTNWAFAAIRSDGSVITWGAADWGGNSSLVSGQLNGNKDVTHVSSTSFAFAAILEDGSVVTWGSKDSGGDSSSANVSLNGTIDVKQLVPTLNAFVAIRDDGSAVAWGSGVSGGQINKGVPLSF